MFRSALLIVLLLTLAPWRQGWAWTVEIQTPAFSQVRSPMAKIESHPEEGRHALSFPDSVSKAELEIPGPLGGLIFHQVSGTDAGKTLQFDAEILTDDDPNPAQISHLPALCPRVSPQKNNPGSPLAFLYRGETDVVNRAPIAQLTDPDRWEGRQSETVRLLDNRNVLMLKSVRIRYDYEDEAIVHRIGTDPLGKPIEVREGRGGFYANFHYAVLPYSSEILSLPEQTLLHLAQGSLKEIDQEKLRPLLRTHGFLPGPFLSRHSLGYALCEWGDTARHAPEQSLNYRGIALWDWDYPVRPADRVLLIVWEGDEEDKARAEGLIPANYLIDDLVAVFEVSRTASLSPLTLKNLRGDFEITVQSGDLNPEPALSAPSLPLAKNP